MEVGVCLREQPIAHLQLHKTPWNSGMGGETKKGRVLQDGVSDLSIVTLLGRQWLSQG